MIMEKNVIHRALITMTLLVVIVIFCYWLVTLCAKGLIYNSVEQTYSLGKPIGIKEGKPQKEINTICKGHSQESVSIVDGDMLTIYYPHYKKIDLVCGTMPSPNEGNVIFCSEAAFTGRERLFAKIFQHGHIAGDHVSSGTRYRGFRCVANTGCFAYYGDSNEWQFAFNEYADCISKAMKHYGMAFGQTMIIYKGKDVHAGWPCNDKSKNQYRALCEINGKICVADAKESMSYKDFIQALIKAGAKHALYLDMGKGWNYSFYRDNSGKVRYIHNYRIPYTTNWITFYK